jgi:hypothetical protein
MNEATRSACVWQTTDLESWKSSLEASSESSSTVRILHKLSQSRGQQGTGIAAAGIYAQLTTGKPLLAHRKTNVTPSATPPENLALSPVSILMATHAMPFQSPLL